MSWGGGRNDGQPVVPWCYCISMSTAIARIYTQQGFAIATDGRATDPEDGTYIAVQKMFPIRQPGLELAYTVAGSAMVTPPGSKEVVYDFASQVGLTAEILAHKTDANLYKYAMGLALMLDFKLREAVRAAAIPLPSDGTQTQIFIDGYYEGRPERAYIEFTHTGQTQSKPQVYKEDLKHRWWGSGVVGGILFDHADPRLSSYKILLADYTLSEAIEVAGRFVSAHCDRGALDIDKEICSHCGPPIRIATVTPSEGFVFLETQGLSRLQ